MFGTRLSETPLKFSHHKSHHFQWKDNVLVSSNDKKFSCKLPNLKYESKAGAEALKFGIPDWITFNNQILKFYAVSFDKRGSSPLVRPYFYHMLYFLEDDSIQIIDKSKSDDLRFQGAHLKRHQIPKQRLHTDDETRFYRLDDFNLNKKLIIYNKTYAIYDCDQYTRSYLSSLGIQVPDRDEEMYQLQRIHLYNRENMHNRPLSCPNYSLNKKKAQRQFLEFDGKVLNLKCLAINHDQKYEKLQLVYYLADDSIEIREYPTEPMTSNYSQQPSKSKILLQRSKIAKVKKPSPIPEDNKDVEHYADRDLIIGSKINIWGRILLIYDCDEFTRHFFHVKYGLDLKAIPLDEIGIMSEDKQHRLRRAQSAMPAIRKKKLSYQPEFVRFVKYGLTVNDSHILRFLAKLGNSNISSWEAKRSFVISYHLVDDTFTVYENHERNAGLKGGVIMQRCKVSDHITSSGRQLQVSDFYVGATLHLNGRWFKLIDSDEYSLSYMEKHGDKFPPSHRMSVLAKLKHLSNGNVKNLKEVFADQDIENVGHIDEETFSRVLFGFQVDNENLSKQEVITLKRSYSNRKTADNKYYINPIYAIQNELRAQHFTEFDLLKSYIKSRDFAKCSRMRLSNVARLCMAYPLPVKKFLIDQAVKTLEVIDDSIDYEQFVDAINWRNYPVSNDEYKSQQPHHATPAMVDYKRLIRDMEELDVNST